MRSDRARRIPRWFLLRLNGAKVEMGYKSRRHRGAWSMIASKTGIHPTHWQSINRANQHRALLLLLSFYGRASRKLRLIDNGREQGEFNTRHARQCNCHWCGTTNPAHGKQISLPRVFQNSSIGYQPPPHWEFMNPWKQRIKLTTTRHAFLSLCAYRF